MNVLSEIDKSIDNERLKRRTFAIISHPDAGKTTLTEKLLLYSGMVRTAGMVRGRKGSKAASSDWMAMEQERGISITASAMQFPYKGALINVLDTPGHQDFSEDTYRTLTAADCAIMVIDAGKGVELQTKKLFKVCKLRGIPIITFINKLDLPAREILELLEEIEELLDIETSPRTWPIGSGRDFKGIIDLKTSKALLFQRGAPGGADKIATSEVDWNDSVVGHGVDADLYKRVSDELELLEVAGNTYDHEIFLAGEQSPVYFGSALTNFGIEHFFDNFVDIASPPRPYKVSSSIDSDNITIQPGNSKFSAFVFKIQANMNPKHRDSMAFMRICSGKFERDMSVVHHTSGKKVRLARSYTMLANDRGTIDAAYAGDVVGVINPGFFAIGDTLSGGLKSDKGGYLNFPPMPTFPPEVVCSVRPRDVMKLKQFNKGITQLCSEGAVQLLKRFNQTDGHPYVAAVGRLQFDVLQSRLKNEYSVDTELEFLPYKFSYLLNGDPKTLTLTQGSCLVIDSQERTIVMVSQEWQKRYIEEQNSEHKLEGFLE